MWSCPMATDVDPDRLSSCSAPCISTMDQRRHVSNVPCIIAQNNITNTGTENMKDDYRGNGLQSPERVNGLAEATLFQPCL